MREPLSGLGASTSAGIPNYGDALVAITVSGVAGLADGLGLGSWSWSGREGKGRKGWMDGEDGIDFMEEKAWLGMDSLLGSPFPVTVTVCCLLALALALVAGGRWWWW